MILKYIFILLFYCYIATDGSPPPPRATSENPSDTWQDSSSPDSITGRSHIQSGEDKGYVRLRSSGPTVRGADLTLSATLVDFYPGEHKYIFRDFDKYEVVEVLTSETVVNHTVKLSKHEYEPGNHLFEVIVFKRNEHDPDTFRFLSMDRVTVTVTELLNGKLKLIQNGFDRSYGRVFLNERVSHVIELSQEELQFLTNVITYIVHWYIDCSLISSTGLSFDHTYENADKTYILEVLVEVEHKPFSSARGVISRRPDGLSGFKCAPIYNSGYTYGYYKASVRADATDGSPPPPRATSENPSNTWQDSSSSDSTTGRSYIQSGADKGYVRLRSSGPTVRGADLTLSATLFDFYPRERKYIFRDVDEPEVAEVLSSETVVNHTVKLSKLYEPGNHLFEVTVFERNEHDPDTFRFLRGDRVTVTVTELLNGKLKLIQNGFDRSYGRVFPNERVSHIIELSQEELQFLTDDNTYIVHWYIDCSLISSTGLSFDYTYENADKTYILEALIEVEHKPFSSARGVISRRPDRLSDFKCAPIYNSGYTYGYYKSSVRADATDGSPPPPRATSENPSNTWQDSSSPDSTTGRSYIPSGADKGYVRLRSSGPTVRGADLTLSATLFDSYPRERKYIFRDVDEPEVAEVLNSETVVNHTVKLSKLYEPGNHLFEVTVFERNEHDPDTFRFLRGDRVTVTVTELLNGKLKLIQNGFDRSYGRVFPNERVSHIIELSQEELQFLTDDNTYIVHWYIDCSLISSTGLSFDYTYENADKTYILEALIEVEHKPFSSARGVISRRPDRLSDFKCAPIYNSGYTYGYYKSSVRADATDGSPPPPRATSENPSNTWQDSTSPDSTTGRSYIQSDKGYVRLRSSGPTVRGADLTLSATLFDFYPRERKYIFRDLDEPEVAEVLSSETVVNHTVKLSKLYEPGNHLFEVTVFERNEHDPDTFRFLRGDRVTVTVTELLNGKLKLIQNGFDRSYGRVFPNERVSHMIELSQEELQFLTDDNTYIVHWYIDCSLISSTGLSFDYTYENADKTYILEALVEVEHKPFSSARGVISRRPDRLSDFKCAPIYNFGYTYGYYKSSVRADAKDESTPPPRATSENPSNTWQDSGFSDSAIESSPRPWSTTPRGDVFRYCNSSPIPASPEKETSEN